MLPLVAILCGGRGTRLQEHTQSVPKPLIEIGGRPILWHVMQIYLAQGFRRFALLTGYRAEMSRRSRALKRGRRMPTSGASIPGSRHQPAGVWLVRRR